MLIELMIHPFLSKAAKWFAKTAELIMLKIRADLLKAILLITMSFEGKSEHF